MKRINKTYKLAFALAMASTAPMVAYSLYGSMADSQAALNGRILSCEQFSLLCALSVQRDDPSILQKISGDLLQRDDSLGGIRITRNDGKTICDLASPSITNQDDFKSEFENNRISSTLYRLQQPWGNVDFYYRTPPQRDTSQQVFVATTLGILFNVLIFALMLRRSLSVLDTSKVVPIRVRNTLNTIPDGVVILDAEGRIIVANDAFQNSTGIQPQDLIGSKLDTIPFTAIESVLPWTDSGNSSKTRSGAKAFLRLSEEDRFFTIGCSPIFDAQENHAGNLVSFQDITTLENQKRKIEHTLKELGESKEKLREQNEKLHELASKDMLTGVFNRRFLFEHLETHWNRSLEQKQSMSVVMLDVDHFKKLNDGHGHAVGDHVLRDVAAVIRSSVPESAVVGRYGGEEFCVILPNLEASGATQAAETIRHAIQTQLEHPYRVTASIGVASNLSEVTTYQMMLDRADKALYAAKYGGRNAVHCWSPSLEKTDPRPLSQAKQRFDQSVRSTPNTRSDSGVAIPSENQESIESSKLREAVSEINHQLQAAMANSPEGDWSELSQLVLELSDILRSPGRNLPSTRSSNPASNARGC